MKRPRPAIVVLVLSITALIGVPIVAAGTSGSAEPEVVSVGARPAPTPTTPERFVPGEPEFEFQRVMPEMAESAPTPVSVAIPRIRVTADVIPSGVAADGQAEVPEDINHVGWYRFGRAPGDEQGAVVLVGHRDGRVGGPGIFYNVGALDVGDKIVVTDEAGQSWQYEVTSREAIERTALPVDELFRKHGDQMLVLISCGGVYDRSLGGYRDNIVVTAQPVVEAEEA
jgi:LPXTG-site transpeptidase (sortase) family protein